MASLDVRGGGRRTPDGYAFEITGGSLALDLTNTVDERATVAPRELLTNWADLVDWSVQAGAIDEGEGGRLRRQGAAAPRDASNVLRRVRLLREVLYDLFLPIACGRTAPPQALAQLNEALSPMMSRLRVAAGDGFDWRWAHPQDALDVMLPPTLLAAADLLRSDVALSRLRVCEAAHRCRWLFLDHSRNRTRRWCDMRVCGNRAKARRHRAARPVPGRAG